MTRLACVRGGVTATRGVGRFFFPPQCIFSVVCGGGFFQESASTRSLNVCQFVCLTYEGDSRLETHVLCVTLCASVCVIRCTESRFWSHEYLSCDASDEGARAALCGQQEVLSGRTCRLCLLL